GELLESQAGPFTVVALEEPRVDRDREPGRRGDGLGRFLRALERRRVDGGDSRKARDPTGHVGGLLAPLVGEVETRSPTGQGDAGRRGLPVTDEQDQSRLRAAAVPDGLAPCLALWVRVKHRVARSIGPRWTPRGPSRSRKHANHTARG